MKLLIVALIAVSAWAISDLEAQNQFVQFSQKYNKKYEVGEVFQRLAIFKEKVEYINKHNSENNTYTLGVNEFSDLTWEEFKATYLMKLDLDNIPVVPIAENLHSGPIANDVDWRGRAVTPVKNQGQCGSCWSFSATGAIEGSNAVSGKGLPNLSEQQLVDCSGSMGNQGCNGGWPSKAIDWAARNGGLCSETGYPYTARQGPCKSGCSKSASTGGAGGVPNSDAGLAGALNGRPVSVALEASPAFQSYRSGVFNGPCQQNLNHAVLAVGYTSNAWIVKNSWGTGWGNGGYIYMARNNQAGGLCGITKVAVISK